MKYAPLPAAWLIQHAAFSWSEALWGVEHGWAERTFLIALACERLLRTSDVTLDEALLAGLSRDEAHQAIDFASHLAETEIRTVGRPEKKWLYLILLWIFEHEQLVGDRLAAAEWVYAEFGYPEEIESFIRYMPAQGSDQPEHDSVETHHLRLLQNWERWLRERGAQFADSPRTP